MLSYENNKVADVTTFTPAEGGLLYDAPVRGLTTLLHGAAVLLPGDAGRGRAHGLAGQPHGVGLLHAPVPEPHRELWRELPLGQRRLPAAKAECSPSGVKLELISTLNRLLACYFAI